MKKLELPFLEMSTEEREEESKRIHNEIMKCAKSTITISKISIGISLVAIAISSFIIAFG